MNESPFVYSYYSSGEVPRASTSFIAVVKHGLIPKGFIPQRGRAKM